MSCAYDFTADENDRVSDRAVKTEAAEAAAHWSNSSSTLLISSVTFLKSTRENHHAGKSGDAL